MSLSTIQIRLHDGEAHRKGFPNSISSILPEKIFGRAKRCGALLRVALKQPWFGLLIRKGLVDEGITVSMFGLCI